MTDNLEQKSPTSERLPTDQTNFLVCVDGSDESRIALHFACAQAKRLSGKVYALHVVEPSDGQSMFSVADKMQDEKRTAGQSLLQDAHDEVMARTNVDSSLLLVEGPVGECIVKTVMNEELAISKLLLGVPTNTTSRGRLVAWLSTQMGNDMHVPLMLVPGSLTEEEITRLA